MSVEDELTEREPGVVVAPAFRADHSRKAKSTPRVLVLA